MSSITNDEFEQYMRWRSGSWQRASIELNQSEAMILGSRQGL